MQGGQLAPTQNHFILLYPESHLNQAVENFQGILHKLWRMKKIKGIQCTTWADMQETRETRWQFLMTMLAKKKNKNEKRIRDSIYQGITLCWTLTQIHIWSSK